LQNYLIAKGYNWDGTTTGNKIAKSLAAKSDWIIFSTTGTIGCDLTKNNSSGFSALPGGLRSIDGSFYGQSDYGSWWSTTENHASYAGGRDLYCVDNDFTRSSYNESDGLSVRLVRD